jgi:hypothetical protein
MRLQIIGLVPVSRLVRVLEQRLEGSDFVPFGPRCLDFVKLPLKRSYPELEPGILSVLIISLLSDDHAHSVLVSV